MISRDSYVDSSFSRYIWCDCMDGAGAGKVIMYVMND